MDYYAIECLFTACALFDTAYAQEKYALMVSDEELRKVWKVAIRLKGLGRKSISKSDLIIENEHGKLGLIQRMIDRIYTEYLFLENRHDGKGFDIEDVLISCITKFEERSKKKNYLNRLKNAEQYVENSEYEKAFEVVESFLFKDIMEQPKTMLESMKSSLLDFSCFKTGIEQIDKAMGGLVLSALMTIAGESGHMKTMISSWLCLKILIANPGFTCCYFQKEMSEASFTRRFIAYLLGITSETILRINTMNGVDRLTEIDRLSKDIDERMQQDDEIASALRRFKIVSGGQFDSVTDIYSHVKRHRATIWCLDYATMMQPTNGDNENYDMFMNKFVSGCNDICLRTQSLGIILSQFKHSALDKQAIKIGTEDDMEWGKHLKQKSSYIFVNFYPWKVDPTFEKVEKDWFYLIGRKNRYGEPLDIAFHADPAKNDFKESITKRKVMLEWLKAYKSGRVK
jgi:hypothetical protein